MSRTWLVICWVVFGLIGSGFAWSVDPLGVGLLVWGLSYISGGFAGWVIRGDYNVRS